MPLQILGSIKRAAQAAHADLLPGNSPQGAYMKKLIFAIIAMLMCGTLHAQPPKSLADLDKAFRQAKSSAAIMALMGDLEQAVPATEADMAILGGFLDKYPEPARKAALKIKNPKLTKAVIKECERQVAMSKNLRAKTSPSDEERAKLVNSQMNSAALIGTLANLRDTAAVPLLRSYLRDKELSGFASIALGRLGDNESFEALMVDIEKRNNIDLSGYGDKGLKRIIEELNKPGIEPKRKFALIRQIKGSKGPERKRLLKDLALNHPDEGVRSRSSQALLNSMLVNPDPADDSYILEWIKRSKNADSGYWAVSSISISHNYGKRPLSPELAGALIDVLKTSTFEPSRLDAARALGIFKVGGALPDLLECTQRDEKSSVRGACRASYWKIAGRILSTMFHPEDVEKFTKKFSGQDYIKYQSTGPDTEDKKYMSALEKAFNEHKSMKQ
jgi:hypothetical protein